MERQQGTKGAIILSWRQGTNSQDSQQQNEVLAESLRYFERLQNDGEITQYRVYVEASGPTRTAVLEGQTERLIDLQNRSDHLHFLLTAGSSLPGFVATTTIGGTSGAAEEVLRLIAEVQEEVQQVQQARQVHSQYDQDQRNRGQQERDRDQVREFAMSGGGSSFNSGSDQPNRWAYGRRQ